MRYPAIVQITDGTWENTVNFLGPTAGYILCDWRPARPGLKYTYKVDPSSGVSRPHGWGMDAPVESFTLTARDSSPGATIAHERKLTRILLAAVHYWTDPTPGSAPYYLAVRAQGEAIIRYATIFDVQFHDSGNPFAQPFASNSKHRASTDLTLALTHDLFSPLVPGTTKAPLAYAYISDPYEGKGISGIHPDNAFNTNQTPSNSDDYSFVGIANHGAINKFDNIFLPTGQDMVNDVMPSNPVLFPAGGDGWTYFGIAGNTSEYVNQHKFLNIVIIPSSISTGSAVTWHAQYYAFELGGWVNIEVRDTTAGMTKPGILSFISPPAWSPTTVNSVEGMYVRVRRATGLASRTYVQMMPYPASWNFATIPASAKGDMGVRVDFRFTQSSWTEPVDGTLIEQHAASNRVMIGTSRKRIISHITPQYHDAPLANGATWNLRKPVDNLFITNFDLSLYTPYFRTLYFKPAPNTQLQLLGGDYFRSVAQVTFTDDGNNMYSGNFRAFLRWYPANWSHGGVFSGSPIEGPDCDWRAQIGYRKGNWVSGSVPDINDDLEIFHTTPTRQFTRVRPRMYGVDLGVITLGDPNYTGSGNINMYQTIDIQWRPKNVRAVSYMYRIADLVLIPVDDYFMEIEVPNVLVHGNTSDYDRDIIVNSASSLGKLEGYVGDHTDDVYGSPQFKQGNLAFPVGSPMYFPQGGDTNLYFFSYHIANGVIQSSLSDTFNLELATQPLYSSAIGDVL